MKCAKCGYYNLPGSVQCGRCTRGFEEAEAPVALEEVLPPRASNRSVRQQVESTLSPATRRGITRTEATAHEIGDGVRRVPGHVRREVEGTREALREIPGAARREYERSRVEVRSWRNAAQWWIPVVASLVPGVGQYLQGRRLEAVAYFGSFLLALLAWWATFRAFNSDILVFFALAVQWIAMFDAALASFPRADNMQAAAFRDVRLAILPFALQSALAFGVLLWISQSFYTINVTEPIGAQWNGNIYYADPRPVFVWDDLLVVRPISEAESLQKGDVVLIRGEDDEGWIPVNNNNEVIYSGGNFVSRVVALPGDRVQSDGKTIRVNGQPVSRQLLPQSWTPPVNYDKIVSKNQMWLAHIVSDTIRTNADFRFTSWAVRSRSDIGGRVTAILNPPARRQFLPSPER